MTQNIRIVCFLWTRKKRWTFINHVGRFHENVEPLCLKIGFEKCFKLEFFYLIKSYIQMPCMFVPKLVYFPILQRQVIQSW